MVKLFSISWSLGVSQRVFGKIPVISLHTVCHIFRPASAWWNHVSTGIFSSLLFLCLSLSLSHSRWCNVKLGTEPSSAAVMRPVLTLGYSSSFNVSKPHFSIISSPACVCERLTADGDYRFLPMNQHEHNWSLSFTFYSPVLSICHQALPTLWAVTPEQDAHLGWTQ